MVVWSKGLRLQNEDSTMAKPISTPKRRKKSSELNPQEPLKERGRWIEKKKKKKERRRRRRRRSRRSSCFIAPPLLRRRLLPFLLFPFFFFFFGLDSMESREPWESFWSRFSEPWSPITVRMGPCYFPIEQFLRLKEPQKWTVRGFFGRTVRFGPGFKTLP